MPLKKLVELRSTVFQNLLTTPEDLKRREKQLNSANKEFDELKEMIDRASNQLEEIISKNNIIVSYYWVGS